MSFLPSCWRTANDTGAGGLLGGEQHVQQIERSLFCGGDIRNQRLVVQVQRHEQLLTTLRS